MGLNHEAEAQRAARLLSATAEILRKAEALYGIQLPRDIRFRTREAVTAKRWVAGQMRMLGMSSPEIARAMGLRSHSGVLHMIGRWGSRKSKQEAAPCR